MSFAVADDALALQRLYDWETADPERVVLTQPMGGTEVREFTWAQVIGEARRMANHLSGLGFAPGARIAILSKNTAHWLISDFAIWLAGFVSVPLYPTLSAGTIRQILEHSGSSLLFVGKLDGWERLKPGIPAELPCISHPLSPHDAIQSYPGWDEIVARTEPLPGEPMRPGDDLPTIVYTSGTTGTPKGVMHSFAAFAWAAQAGLGRMPIDESARILSHLPLSHVVERTLVEHGLLATGMHVYFAESLETFAADLRRARPTVFITVPRLWMKFQQGVLARIPARRLERLLGIPILRAIVRRKILAALGLDRCGYAGGGAAPMPPELLRWYARLGLNIVEGYGMTENCAVSHITLPDVPRPGTVGPPYPGVQSRIDPATGEIQMNSGAVMLGYYREPELTRQAFTDDGWLRTADKGTLDPEGNLTITGRLKDLFKTSKGKYVAPAPIEDKLSMHPAVEACCVTGANLAQPLGLAVLTADAAKIADAPTGRRDLEQSLQAHLKQVNETLDPHERLDCLVVMTEPWTTDSDLITPTFKVKRNRVEERFARHYPRWVGSRRAVVWHPA
ncbi:MAG TPA: AMP-binding protein [Rhodocyclaceae bacterium]|nr:AMP-binding protein [Rhodocyclaceae bacterium]